MLCVVFEDFAATELKLQQTQNKSQKNTKMIFVCLLHQQPENCYCRIRVTYNKIRELIFTIFMGSDIYVKYHAIMR